MNKRTQRIPCEKHLSCDYLQFTGELIKLAKILNYESTFPHCLHFPVIGSSGLR